MRYFFRIAVLAAAWCGSVRGEPWTIASQAGDVRFTLTPRADAAWTYEVAFRGRRIAEPARIGLLLDGVDVTTGATVAEVESYERDENYPLLGAHAIAHERSRGAKLSLRRAGAIVAVLEARVMAEGAAFRWLVPAGERPRVPDAATDFRLPRGSTVWYHDLGGHYEAVYARRTIAPRRETTPFPIPRAGEWRRCR